MSPESDALIQNFKDFLITPAIMLVFAAGFFVFVWGLVQFLWSINQGADRSEGVQHMIWGVIGMLVMVSVQGILMLLDNTFDLDIPPSESQIERDFNRSTPTNIKLP